MSLVSLLGIARSALMTQSRAMNVTAHNVANAQTPGYSRQRLDVLAATPMWTALGTVGRGVTDAGINRARADFHDAATRRESGLLGHASTLHDLLGQVEGAFGEPSETGLGAALDALFGAFADLANDPSSPVGREMVRLAADRVVRQLRGLDDAVAQAATDALAQARGALADVNTLTAQIADLNVQIRAAGGRAPDLEDQRGVLLDRLAELVAVRVVPHDDGTVTVLAGGRLVVDAGVSRELELQSAGGSIAVGAVGGGAPIDPGTGTLGGLLELLNQHLPDLRAELDTLAASLVTEVNALHRAGVTPAGATGTDFFDPAGVTAGTIALTAAVAADGGAIAAGATAAAGDGAIALQLAGLGSTGLASLGGGTLREQYVTLASSLGLAVRTADQQVTTHQALLDQAQARRESVRGVSVDEEMVDLIAQQQAYAAAAHLVQVADEMVQTLLEIV